MNKENDLLETKTISNLDIFNLSHFLQNQFLSDTIIANKIEQKEYLYINL